MQSLLFTGRRTLISTLTIIGLLVIIFLVILGVIFASIQNEQNNINEQALEVAMNQSPLKTVNTSYVFNGDSSYVVFTGEDKQGELIHVFVPQQDDELNVEWIKASKGYNKEKITQKWESSCDDCELMDVNLGILNNRYVWEMIFEKNNRLYFQTYRFTNGELYDSISFQQN